MPIKSAFYKLALIAALATTHTNAWSQDEPNASHAASTDERFNASDSNHEMSWLPAERWDMLTGNINFYHVDLDLPGNSDLPVRIAHSVKNGREARYAWDIPRLTFATFGGGVTWQKRDDNNDYYVFPGEERCGGLKLARAIETWEKDVSDGREYRVEQGTEYLRSALTFHFGERAVHFFPNSQNEFIRTDAANAGRFPANAAYISPENWYITCTVNSQNKANTFKVHTNTGRVYTLDYWRHGQGNSMSETGLGAANGRTNVSVFASRIEDTKGNWVAYSYDRFTWTGTGQLVNNPSNLFSRLNLKRIEANDGRKLYFRPSNRRWTVTSYDPDIGPTSENPYKRIYYSYKKDFHVIDENDERLTYRFSSRTIGYNVERLTYPSGGRIDYEYTYRAKVDHIARGRSYWPEGQKLKTRTVSGGGRYEFSYESIGDSSNPIAVRLIRTPTTLLEYRVRKTEKNEFAVSSAISAAASSGRLMSFRNHGALVTWREDLRPQLQRDYVWHRLPSLVNLSEALDYRVPTITGLQNWHRPYFKRHLAAYFDSYQVALKKETVTHYRTDGVPIIFSTTHSDWDKFGNSRRTVEVSNDNESRTTTRSYWQGTGSHWINSKLSGRVLYLQSGRGRDTLANSYNNDGLLSSQTRNGIVTTYQYRADGTLEWIKDAEGHYHYYSNYFRGTPRQEINRRGDVMYRSVNDNGTIKSQSAWGGGNVQTFEYDVKRRLSKTRTAGTNADENSIWISPVHHQQTQGNRRTETHYDLYGRVRFTTVFDLSNDSNRISTVQRYDDTGRLIFKSLPNRLTLDEADNLATVDIKGTHYQYDGLDRLKETHFADTRKGRVRFLYNSNGFNFRTTDEKNNWRIQDLRAYGDPSDTMTTRLVVSGGVGATTITRDRLGRVRSVTRDGLTRSWDYYTSSQLLKSHTNPEHGTTTYTYFADGQLKQTENQDSLTKFTYKPNNLIESDESIAGGKSIKRVSDYDQRNLLTSIATQSTGYAVPQQSNVSYDHDADGNLLSETMSVDGQQFALTYTYNANGVAKSIAYPTDRLYTLKPDALGFSREIAQVGGENKTMFSGIDYHSNGLMALAQITNFQLKQTIDSSLNLPAALETRGVNNALLVYQKYYYDNALNVDKIEDLTLGQTLDLDYDRQNRLKYASSPSIGNWSIAYDPRDNISAINQDGVQSNFYYNRSANRLDRIESPAGTRQFQYDSRGNTINTGKQSIAFMANNHVDSVDGEHYVYDGHGRRVLTYKKDNNKIYHFYDASGTLRYRYDAGASIESEYHYVAGKLHARRDSGSDNPPDDGTDTGGTSGYLEIFRDDFSGTSVSSNFFVPSWSIPNRAAVNNASSCSQSDGHLYLAVKNVGTESQACYLISNFNTIGPGDNSTIKVDIRANVSSVKALGTWFAGWVYPEGINPDGSHPAEDNNPATGAEFDVFEYMPTWNSAYNTAIHDGESDQGWIEPYQHDIDLTADAFHTFSMEWNKDCVVFSIDGVHGRSTTSALISKSKNHRLHLTMEAQTGQQWGFWDVGDLRSNLASVPAVGRIDWVSVSEKNAIDPNLCSNAGSTGGGTSSGGDDNGSTGSPVDEVTVDGYTISWPDDGWYQVQNEADYSNVCDTSNDGFSCTVAAGTYQIINHTTNTKLVGVVVPSESGNDGSSSSDVTEVTVDGYIIRWPDDGWYQVQNEADYSNVCDTSNDGFSCTVAAGTYQIINHTTNTKQTGVVVPSGSNGGGGSSGGNDSGGSSGSDVTEVTVTGYTISWPDDGWYQVQNEADYSNVCDTSNDGTSCTVAAGSYQVINHTNNTKDTGVIVPSSDNGAVTVVTVVGNTVKWPDDGWYQVQRETDYVTVCDTSQDGTSCVVDDGSYQVINHTTNVKQTGLQVPQ